MNKIRRRSFNLKSDFANIYSFMIDIYHIDRRNGPAAMFFEHMQEFPWTHSHLNYKNAIWEDNERIIGFCFFDQRLGTAYFNLEEGYDMIISEMIKYAENELCDSNGNLEVKLYSSQENFINYIKNNGYIKNYEYQEGIYDYAKGKLDYPLPDGFTFELPEDCDVEKKSEAIWKGFDNTTSPIIDERLECDKLPCSHKTPQLDVVIKNSKGEYICCAGVSMIKENQCVYLRV